MHCRPVVRVQRPVKGCDTFTIPIGLQAAGRIYPGERWPALGSLSIACQLTTGHRWRPQWFVLAAPRESGFGPTRKCRPAGSAGALIEGELPCRGTAHFGTIRTWRVFALRWHHERPCFEEDRSAPGCRFQVLPLPPTRPASAASCAADGTINCRGNPLNPSMRPGRGRTAR